MLKMLFHNMYNDLYIHIKSKDNILKIPIDLTEDKYFYPHSYTLRNTSMDLIKRKFHIKNV